MSLFDMYLRHAERLLKSPNLKKLVDVPTHNSHGFAADIAIMFLV